MRPRYKGCKLIGKEINKYTDYDQSLTHTEWRDRNQIFNASNKGYITTTKPLDGTFPFPFTLKRDTSLNLEAFFSTGTKGNLLFPIPYRNIKSLKDIIEQNGNLIGYPVELSQVISAVIAHECQQAGGYRRDRSYGKNPVIEVKTNTIYEFDWGGSAYPEIEKGGAVHLKQIINVDNYGAKLKVKGNTHIVNENDSLYDEWDQNLQKSLQKGDQITLKQYSEKPDKSSGVPGDPGYDPNTDISAPVTNNVVLEPGLNAPTFGGIYTEKKSIPITVTSSAQSNFQVPFLPREPGLPYPYDDRLIADSNGNQVLASSLRNISGSYYVPTTGSGISAGTIYAGENPYIYHRSSNEWNYLKIDPNGRYTTGSEVPETSVYLELSASLSDNNRHFISFYKGLGNNCIGNLGQIGKPIEVKSVTGTTGGTPKVEINLKSNPPVTGSLGLGGIGILIWKAKKGAFVTLSPPIKTLFDEYSYSRLKEGGFYREFSIDSIKNNFNRIVETVGSKPLK
jgi:hypothetical protein